MNPSRYSRTGGSPFRFGVHVSIAGGIDRIFARGDSLGCGAVQLFSHSSRSWDFPVPEEEDLLLYRRSRVASRVDQVFIHASYLINIASEEPLVLARSRETLHKELVTADRLGADGLVLHPGSAKKGNRAEALARAAEVLREVLDLLPAEGTPLLLENTAGAGSMLGSTPEEMSFLFGRVGRPARMGLCLDSCHLFASGYDIASQGEYDRVLESFRNASPSGGIALWHLNDALFGLGSGRDRHAGLGEGTLGLPALERIVKGALASNVPLILETPKGEGETLDRMNLRTLCSLAGRPYPEPLSNDP